MPKSFKTVPQRRSPSAEAVEAFVSGGAGTDTKTNEATKRLSIDLPEGLHTRFKIACVKAHKKMGPEIVALIEKRVKELENQSA